MSSGAEYDFETKGSMIRGLVLALRESGQIERVRAKVSRETAQMLVELPPASKWIPGRFVAELQTTIWEELGESAARSLAARSVGLELGPLSRALTEGFLRLFGAVPETLFSRSEQFLSFVARGVRVEWVARGPGRGDLLMSYPRSRYVHRALPEMSAAMHETTYALCRTTGTVRMRGWKNALQNECVLECAWSVHGAPADRSLA